MGWDDVVVFIVFYGFILLNKKKEIGIKSTVSYQRNMVGYLSCLVFVYSLGKEKGTKKKRGRGNGGEKDVRT